MPNFSRPSECNLVDFHVLRDGSTSSRTIARNDVDNTRREASLTNHKRLLIDNQ